MPQPGTYTYAVEGRYLHPDGLSGREHELPDRATEEVAVDTRGSSAVVSMAMDAGDVAFGSTLVVDNATVRLSEVVNRDRSGAVESTYRLEPTPAPTLIQRPLEVGSTSDFSWSDPALGARAEGTATVVGRERVSVPAGDFEAFVVEVRQELTGSVTGTSLLTTWIDPRTGSQIRRLRDDDLETPGGPMRLVLDMRLERVS